MIDPLMAFGHPLYQRFSRLVSFGVFVLRLLESALRNWRRAFGVLLDVTAFQIYFTCIQALPIVFFISFSVVAVFISQADNFIGSEEAAQFVANLFAIVVVRELAPLMTALIVVGRSGTAIASELASMTANEEISALRTMGIDPYHYLVIPRVLGMTVSVVCLSLTFSLLAMFFTMIIGYCDIGVSPGAFLGGLTRSISGTDLALNFFKSAAFGIVISVLCSFWGLSVRGAVTEIPQATTRAVIASVLWCFVVSAIVTVLVY